MPQLPNTNRKRVSDEEIPTHSVAIPVARAATTTIESTIRALDIIQNNSITSTAVNSRPAIYILPSCAAQSDPASYTYASEGG